MLSSSPWVPHKSSNGRVYSWAFHDSMAAVVEAEATALRVGGRIRIDFVIIPPLS
jgi:hypothetical protein